MRKQLKNEHERKRPDDQGDQTVNAFATKPHDWCPKCTRALAHPRAHTHTHARHPRAGRQVRHLSEEPLCTSPCERGEPARSGARRFRKTGDWSTNSAWQVRQFASEGERVPRKQKAPPPPGSPHGRWGCAGGKQGVCAGAVHTSGRSRARSFRWWGDRPALVSAGTRHARACGTGGP